MALNWSLPLDEGREAEGRKEGAATSRCRRRRRSRPHQPGGPPAPGAFLHHRARPKKAEVEGGLVRFLVRAARGGGQKSATFVPWFVLCLLNQLCYV